jgi:hypothetical protein
MADLLGSYGGGSWSGANCELSRLPMKTFLCADWRGIQTAAWLTLWPGLDTAGVSVLALQSAVGLNGDMVGENRVYFCHGVDGITL